MALINLMKIWRFAGIDDSFNGNKCYIVGCVTANFYVEGFMCSEIKIDGLDSTDKIISMIRRSKFREQIKCIFLNGITFGGFNVADIQRIYKETGIPVIVVLRRRPNMEEFLRVAEKLHDSEKRIRIIKRAGEIFEVNGLFVQLAGIELDNAKRYLKAATFKGKIPEALRIAHLAASAFVHGESKGKV